MFTGIITDLGEVRSSEQRGDLRAVLGTNYDTATIDTGASIACSGVCLTVVDKGDDWFAVDVSAETRSCTTLGSWKPGRKVNLERSLKVGDELGGHIVSGHVDGVGTVASIAPDGDSLRFRFSLPPELARYVAGKGSVAVEGVSLTVNEVDAEGFEVNIIPHTRQHTNLGQLKPGDGVNIEIDMLARYVARLMERP